MTINKTRRSLIQGVSLGGMLGAVPYASAASLKSVADKLQRDEFPMPDFAALVGESVTISDTEGLNLNATIEEVADINYASDAMQRPGYIRPNAKVVRFALDSEMSLDNTLYQVSHAKLGRLELLLAPVPDAKGKLGLEAIFN